MRAAQEQSAEQEVLRIALEVAREVRAGPGAPAPGPVETGSSLERDLGLDSLGRAELVARLERTFGVDLPEQVLGDAETPADLARALAAARSRDGAARGRPQAAGMDEAAAGDGGGSAAPASGGKANRGGAALAALTFEGGPAEAAPLRMRTLVEVLEWIPAGAAEPFQLDLARYFAAVFGESGG